MNISAIVSRGLSVLVFAGSVAAASQVVPANAVAVHADKNDGARIALTGPRPEKGTNIDPCTIAGNCIAHIG
ncbi:hypothetical protein HW509_00650 [Asaia spathodeae]|uniref:hypothetical protein n=1 Tax=Asaia spathodeae TaxID=657016 RepID=UPI002FC2D6FE